MKKMISFISAILLIALLSASCSSIDDLLNKKEKKITINVLTYGQHSFDEYKAHLEEVFPQIKFEVYSTDYILFENPYADYTYEERLLLVADIIKEIKVDLYFGFSPTIHIADYPLVDLASLIERDQTQFNEIQQKIIETNTNSDGILTSLSPTFNRKVLFVNRALFQDNGVSEPVSPLSWDDFRLSAKQLKESNDSISGYAFDHINWHDMLQQVGEDIQGLQYINDKGTLMLDQPEWRDLAKQLLDDYKGQILRNGIQNDSAIFNITRDTGMYIGKATDISTYIDVTATSDTLAIMDLPINPNNPMTNLYYGDYSFSIDGESSYSNEIWEMITYLMSKEAATFISSNMNSQGFVTYPELEPLYSFDLNSFTGIEENSSIKKREVSEENFQLIDNSKEIVTSTVESEFVDYINGNSDFDQMWVAIEDMVRDINSVDSNFFSNK